MSSRTTLSRFPPELRRQIFLEVAASDPGCRSLLVALRPTAKDSGLYVEALEACYDVRNCIISWTNMEGIEKLSPETKKMIRFLQIDFSVHTTTSSPMRFQEVFQYTTDHDGRMLSHQKILQPVCHVRYLPRPTFATMAAFAGVRTLRLDAAGVEESRFHQIEGLVARALQACAHLRRVEVRSDETSAAAWRGGAYRAGGVKVDRELTANHWWVARLNRGMGVSAKLMTVDTLCLSWHWFWQAAGRKTLSWTEKKEPMRMARRVIGAGIQQRR